MKAAKDRISEIVYLDEGGKIIIDNNIEINFQLIWIKLINLKNNFLFYYIILYIYKKSIFI